MTDNTTQVLPSEATFSGLPQITPRAANHGSLRSDLASVINRYSRENGSNTPDFMLAAYLCDCLKAWNAMTKQREKWYGREPGQMTQMIPTAIEITGPAPRPAKE